MRTRLMLMVITSHDAVPCVGIVDRLLINNKASSCLKLNSTSVREKPYMERSISTKP
jgi:hypothetical protein